MSFSRHLLLKNCCWENSESSDLNLSEKLQVLKCDFMTVLVTFFQQQLTLLFVVNWPKIITCCKFNIADVQFIFFTFENQQA